MTQHVGILSTAKIPTIPHKCLGYFEQPHLQLEEVVKVVQCNIVKMGPVIVRIGFAAVFWYIFWVLQRPVTECYRY